MNEQKKALIERVRMLSFDRIFAMRNVFFAKAERDDFRPFADRTLNELEIRVRDSYLAYRESELALCEYAYSMCTEVLRNRHDEPKDT